LDVTDQVLSIFAGTRGYLDPIPVAEVAAWVEGMLAYVRTHKQALWQKITGTKNMDDATMTATAAAMGEYQKQYAQKKHATTVKT
jgi:F-type H+-transporting ATPase subunit alpha